MIELIKDLIWYELFTIFTFAILFIIYYLNGR
jgi:hypothetical protein